MYHYTFVRMDIREKLASVSNRGNYGKTDEFLRQFDAFELGQRAVPHPHPVIGQLYHQIRAAPNYFGIALSELCPKCFFKRERCVCN